MFYSHTYLPALFSPFVTFCVSFCVHVCVPQLALLNPIQNPDLELAIVMLIVPFFVNVSLPSVPVLSESYLKNQRRGGSLRRPGVKGAPLCSTYVLFSSLQALMFWVVDNFLMKKHRTKAKQEEREEDSRGNSKVRYRRAMSHDDSESEVSPTV